MNKAIRSNKAISINEKEKLAIGEGNQTNMPFPRDVDR